MSWEVRGASGKPLLHLWAENCNVTRRVLAITDQSEERIMLAVERFGRATPDRLEIVRLNFRRSTKQISREDFCEQLRRVLAEKFPDETVEKISTAADLEHSLSRMYARGTFRKGGMRGAFLAVPEGESQDAVESSLTFALLWLERARGSKGKPVSFLRLILPEGKASLLRHQLGSLDPRLAIQVYELSSLHEDIERVDPVSDGNVNTWLVPRRESEVLLSKATSDLARIIAMAPEAISVHALARKRSGFAFPWLAVRAVERRADLFLETLCLAGTWSKDRTGVATTDPGPPDLSQSACVRSASLLIPGPSGALDASDGHERRDAAGRHAGSRTRL